MNSTLAHESGSTELVSPPAEPRSRWIPGLLIVCSALAYYGSYWHFWFNPHDEGGTVCLIAQRLMAGERPWADVELGYNIGWFYPVIALFHLTGVNYLAARAFFFALATCTALLGCGIVTRISGSRWLGLGVGLLLVVLPGSQFKNYIPLAEAANTACLIHLLHIEFATRRRWFGAVGLGGVVLGATFLVRVEIALFFLAIWCGLLLLLLLDRRLKIAARFVHACLAASLLALAIFAMQVPAFVHLRALGVERQFLHEYARWFEFLRASAASEIAHPSNPQTLAAASSAPADTDRKNSLPAMTTSIAHAIDDRTILVRRPLADFWFGTGAKSRLLAFLTYAPFVGFGFFLLVAVVGFVGRVWRREFTIDGRPMQWLLLAGGSLTTFPQFFFFRPDRPHLSEFMPGFIIAMAGCTALLWPRKNAPRPQRLLASVFAAGLAVHLAAFAVFAFQHPSSGTIAARADRKQFFAGENGVRVFASKREAQTLAGVRDAVLAHSERRDYLICYPYMPGYNVMVNRRTYLRNVYVDNATRSSDWSNATIRDFEQKQPAVVILDDRAINGADASRFSHWAPDVSAFVKTHYTRVAHFETVEVFAKTPPARIP